MFSVKANLKQHRLEVAIKNVYDEEDLKTVLFLINREVIKLNPGWTAALDLRGMRVLEQKLTIYIKRIQRTFLDNSVVRIATLVDNSVLRMQVQRMGSETGSNSMTTRFNSENAWRSFLATPPKINKSN